MISAENFKDQLLKRFSFLSETTTVPRERRIFSTVPLENLKEVAEFAQKNLGFVHLSTITGQDEAESLTVMYHFARHDGNGTLLSVKIIFPKENHAVPSLIEFYPSADLYEREVHDLLGINITGHPPGERYPLPEDWPDGQYPLRKDWKPHMLAETGAFQGKGGEK